MPLSHPPTLLTHRRKSPSMMHRRYAGDSFAAMFPDSALHLRRILAAALLFAAVSLCCLVFLRGVDYFRFRFIPSSHFPTVFQSPFNDSVADADIMWLRDPFPRFHHDADFQIACDHFTGSFDDVENRPNGGFNFVKSNNRSILFYKFWHSSQQTYPGYHDQDVLNFIKEDPFIADIGLKMRFLDTANFGGLCEPSRDLNQVCTMHANCCYGMDSKLHDLRIMLEDWKYYLTLPPSLKRLSIIAWRVPQKCSVDSVRPQGSPDESVQED